MLLKLLNLLSNKFPFPGRMLGVVCNCYIGALHNSAQIVGHCDWVNFEQTRPKKISQNYWGRQISCILFYNRVYLHSLY